MYIKELNKETQFIRVYDDAFLVDVVIKDGIKTIRTSTNVFKAKKFTVQEAYEEAFSTLSERDITRLQEAHVKDDSYSLLSRTVGSLFRVIKPDNLDYGYSNDAMHEAKLLTSMDMAYMFTPEVVAIESVDEIKEEDLPDGKD